MIYETDKDRIREAQFSVQIEERFGCQLIKMSMEWQFDYLIARSGQLTGLAEAKCRTHESTKYDTVILSDHKVQYGLRFATKVLCYDEKSKGFVVPKFIFFVKFTDKAMYHVIDKDVFNGLEMKKLSAANHADDPNDTEYVRYIPIKLFKEF